MAGVAADGSELARQQLEDLRGQQRAISGVLRAVARSVGLQPVLDEVVDACTQLCAADNGALWLLEGALLLSVAHHGEAETAEYDRQHPHALDRTTAAGRTAVAGETGPHPGRPGDPEYAYPGPNPNRAMLGVPVMVEDDLIGVVVLVRRDAQPFTDEHIALVQTSPTRRRSRSRTRA